jgi:predicted O-linked N-acetylglucosamine transferase (SPINDLY family)
MEAFAAHRRGDLAGAERLYREMLLTAPSDAELHYHLGLLCYQTGRAHESMKWLKDALVLAPGSVPALQLLIRVCDETGDAAAALLALDQYLAQCPGDAGMLNVKGQQLARLGRLRDAEQAFRQAAERTGNAAMFHDLGLCRQLLGNPSGAADAFAEAVRRGHDHPRTRLWLAQCLRATGRTKEYYDVITDAARSAPADIELLIEAQSARRYVCDWDGFDENRQQLLTGLRQVLEANDGQNIPPGILNYLEVDEGTISAIARRYAGQISAVGILLRKKLRVPPARRNGEKIRLGYLSTDFFAHAVGSLVRDLFSCHDRAHFDVYGYTLRHQPDEVQTRIQQGFDQYRNLSGRSADDIVRSILEDQIDILIDLAGYTSAAQPAALAARPAPIQISWLGYLGTSGSDFIDYIIADDIVLPPELARDYTERIIRLPHFMVTSALPVSEQRPSREDVSLTGDGFVFCSFNQPYKLDHSTFEAWMEILRHVPGSRFWMYVPDLEICGENLRREAARLDVEPSRLIFAGREPMAKHIARMSLADLALDPFHISGGATSVAALAAGVPVLTLRGNSYLARMGSSINASLGMDSLDCLGPKQYVAKAIELATTPSALAAIKEKLGTSLPKNSFFDTRCFVRSLEAALQIVWDRHKKGLPPADVQTSELSHPNRASLSHNRNADD